MRTTTIGELAAEGCLVFGDGYRTKRAELDSAGYRIIRVADISDGQVHLRSPDFVSKRYSRVIGSKAGHPGDILLTTKGTVGRVAVYTGSSGDVVYSPQICYFRIIPNRKIAARYLEYWFSSPEFMQQASYRKGNTDMADYLNLADVRSLQMELPPFDQQRAIVEVLGALDDKIAVNRKVAAISEQLANAHFAQCVSRFVPESSDWTIATIMELGKKGAITFGDGYRTKRAELESEGYRIIRVADVVGGEIHLDSPDFVSYERRGAIGAKAGQVGDIVLTTKGTVGRVAVFEGADEEVVYSPQVCFFRVRENEIVERSYLRRWFSSPSFASQASYRKGNTDMADYINLADIGSLQLTLPTIGDQRALATALEPLDGLIASLRKESRSLSSLRDALLPRLLSGELRVQDAEKSVEQAL
ncbi:restriction endonuclease subunit S [Rhodococcus zopfii]